MQKVGKGAAAKKLQFSCNGGQLLGTVWRKFVRGLFCDLKNCPGRVKNQDVDDYL